METEVDTGLQVGPQFGGNGREIDSLHNRRVKPRVRRVPLHDLDPIHSTHVSNMEPVGPYSTFASLLDSQAAPLAMRPWFPYLLSWRGKLMVGSEINRNAPENITT